VGFVIDWSSITNVSQKKSKMVKEGYERCYSVYPKWGIKNRVDEERNFLLPFKNEFRVEKLNRLGLEEKLSSHGSRNWKLQIMERSWLTCSMA
jgi:hypothetical protein